MSADYRDALIEMAGNEMDKLRMMNSILSIALKSVYNGAKTISGREAIQTLIDGGVLKLEDFNGSAG